MCTSQTSGQFDSKQFWGAFALSWLARPWANAVLDRVPVAVEFTVVFVAVHYEGIVRLTVSPEFTDCVPVRELKRPIAHYQCGAFIGGLVNPLPSLLNMFPGLHLNIDDPIIAAFQLNRKAEIWPPHAKRCLWLGFPAPL